MSCLNNAAIEDLFSNIEDELADIRHNDRKKKIIVLSVDLYSKFREYMYSFCGTYCETLYYRECRVMQSHFISYFVLVDEGG